ncbi:MAG: B12-binding domain-containing protein, partial [Pyrinomonadaceae bacterium]
AGLLKSERTKGGHRRFRVEEVAKFQAQNGLGIKQTQGDETPLRLARTKRKKRSVNNVPSFLHALLVGCEEEAASILIKAYLYGDELPKIFDQIVSPAMCQIGEMWFSGQINVAQEHLATRVVYNALHRLRSSIPPKEPSGELAFCCAFEGDFHELPTYLSQMIFEMHGWEVMNFGANTPLYSLAEEAILHTPEVICISATILEDYERLVRDYADFRSKIAKLKTPIILGGRVFEDERVRQRFPADDYMMSFNELSKFVQKISAR